MDRELSNNHDMTCWACRCPLLLFRTVIGLDTKTLMWCGMSFWKRHHLQKSARSVFMLTSAEPLELGQNGDSAHLSSTARTITSKPALFSLRAAGYYGGGQPPSTSKAASTPGPVAR